MKIVLLLINLVLAQVLSAQDYDQNMKNALKNWKAGKATEAAAQFEKIAASTSDQWLPNYYVGLVNTTSAFEVLNTPRADTLLKKAEKAIGVELEKTPKNAELLVVRALILTAYLAKNPMEYGQSYYPKVNQIYAEAVSIAPENPRVVLEKAMFELESINYVGGDKKPICKDLKKAEQLFDTFKKLINYNSKFL